MKYTDPTLKIAILNYPGAQVSATYGLLDLLQVANQLHQEKFNDGIEINALPIDMQHSPSSSKTQSESRQSFAALILPPSLDSQSTQVNASATDPWLTWIQQQHQQGAVLCSVCSGAFRLAQTGVLNGRPATTHWGLGERFAAQFPEVQLNTDKLLIDDNDIMTAGGMMAWTDLGLRLVERFLGTETMLAVSGFFLIDPNGREQRYYSAFSPSLSHQDKHIIKAQHWLQSHSAEESNMARLADIANLSERTLLRRFKKATGLTPTEYIQHLRIDRARELLGLSINIDEVAWQVGYKDSASFRRTFQKIIGLSPREYRNRFSSPGNQPE